MLMGMGWRVPNICVLCIAVLIIYGIGNWAYISARNYQGYCSMDGVIHKIKLDTKERLDIAVARYLRSQTLMDLNEIELFENDGRRSGEYFESLKSEFVLVPYSSKSDFYRSNPDCCELTWNMVEGDQFGFWERASGSGNGMFVFNHKIRYFNRGGVEKEIYSRSTYLSVDNCGYAKYKFYH
ncbi:hypothetical protein [Aeromonas veronii]|uniref:hypothetical protein n=1 Tax=Aeromonas veronii TaxID=654 RepID=UPI003F7B2809